MTCLGLLPDRDMCEASLTASETPFKPTVVQRMVHVCTFPEDEATATQLAILLKQETPEATHPQA